MTRFILALAFLISVPAFSADDDVLDSAQIASDYPTLIKRAEKRDRNNDLVCGLVIRCKLPTEKECRVQYKSEKVAGVYSVIYAPGSSQVKRGKNGSLQVGGTFGGDVRAPQSGISAPIMSYSWEVDGQLSYDDSKKLFTYTQKQKTASVKATFNNQTQDAGSFGLNDITHCAGMIQIAP
jgi:hypothetical protein